MADQRVSSFGEFQFDRESLGLSRRGRAVPVSTLPLRILEMLIEAEGRLVTRTEFKQALWPYAVRIDTERRLNTAVRALREVLGDDGREPRFVETVRGRGYRWIAARMSPESAVAGWRFAPFLFTVLLLMTGSNAEFQSNPGSAAQARLVRAASTQDPRSAWAQAEALVRDEPGFADAHHFRAQLALDQWRDFGPSRFEAAETAIADAVAAIGSTPTLQVMQAELALAGRWDWPGAERLYRAALSKDPDNVQALRGLAWLYVNSGRSGQAWGEISRLLALSALTAEARADLGWLLIRMGRADVAASLCSADSQMINLLACRHTALAAIGADEPARKAALALMEAAGAQREAMDQLREGPAAEAYSHFLGWQASAFLPRQASAFQQAQVQAAARDYSTAFDSLDRAYRAREPLLVKLGSTPEFAPMKSDPRFRAMLRAVLAGA